MTPAEQARVIDDCATKVGAWSTMGCSSHQERLTVQTILLEASLWLKDRAEAIRSGTAKSLYE